MSDPIRKSESFLAYISCFKSELKGGMSLAILRSLVMAPIPWLTMMILDQHVPNADKEGIFITFGIIVSLLMMHYAFAVAGSRSMGSTVSGIIHEMRSRIFNRMQFLSFSYLDQNTSGRLLSKYAFDTQKIQDTMLLILNQLIPNIIFGLCVIVILMLMNWQLAIILVVCLPLLHFMKVVFHKRLKQRNHHARMAQENLTGKASEMISALRLVRSLGEEQRAEKRLHPDSQHVAWTRIELIELSSIFGTFMFISNHFITAMMVAGGAILVIHDMLTIGTLFGFIAGVPMIMLPLNMIAQFAESYLVGAEAYTSVRELLEESATEGWGGDRDLFELRGEITFDNVTFAYPGKEEEPVLRDFNLQIRAGENVALVGASGSGKSTVASLVLGLYDVQQGTIRVDRINQRDLKLRHFRKQAAIVMQDNLLLSGSIMENLGFAREDASEEEIRAAARAANAEEFIERLPQGFHTVIGERGVSLSGGQRQRLSIARAILRNPKILILDEATSALDNESEALIQEALDYLAKGRTVITIAHRLSTIRNADRIIVMGEGRILEQGSFEELAARPTAFRKLLDKQLSASMELIQSA